MNGIHILDIIDEECRNDIIYIEPNKTDLELTTLVKEMRQRSGHKEKCKREQDLLTKCIYCKRYLSSQEWSGIMETYIKGTLGIEPSKNNNSGDGFKNNKNIEIKVTLGAEDGQFNIVQIRPDHDVHLYLLVCYDMYEGEKGQVYVILLTAAVMYELVLKYGGYAHGTVSKLGKITELNMFNRNLEYALRPNPRTNTTNKPYKLWCELLNHVIEFDEQVLQNITC